MWPARDDPGAGRESSTPTLSSVVTALSSLGKAELPAQLARWLDQLDETGRWALLKLVTGGLRIGVFARLAKTAIAALGDKEAHEIELIWPGSRPPYVELFAWLEGRADKPTSQILRFRPAMLAHAIEDGDLAALDPADFFGEWKWDGIRVQAAAGVGENGRLVARLYSRTGEDISASFPDLVGALRLPGAIDGELLIVRDGRVQSFNVLQQRLNRKTVSDKLMSEFPAHLRAYDLLVDGEEDLCGQPFTERRMRLNDLSRASTSGASIFPAGGVCELGGARGRTRKSGHCRRGRRRGSGGGHHAQATRRALSSRPNPGSLVEMEARPAHHRRGADVRAAR